MFSNNNNIINNHGLSYYYLTNKNYFSFIIDLYKTKIYKKIKINKKKKILNFLKRVKKFKNSKTTTCFSFFLYFNKYTLNFFFKKKVYLKGGLIAPYLFEFEKKKKWFKKEMSRIFILKKKTKNNIFLINNKIPTYLLKNFYFSNFYYFKKLNLKFFNFKFFIKITNLKLKKVNESFFTKPYSYLYFSKKLKFPFNPYILNFQFFFKQYYKIFNITSRLFFLFRFKNYIKLNIFFFFFCINYKLFNFFFDMFFIKNYQIFDKKKNFLCNFFFKKKKKIIKDKRILILKKKSNNLVVLFFNFNIFNFNQQLKTQRGDFPLFYKKINIWNKVSYKFKKLKYFYIIYFNFFTKKAYSSNFFQNSINLFYNFSFFFFKIDFFFFNNLGYFYKKNLLKRVYNSNFTLFSNNNNNSKFYNFFFNKTNLNKPHVLSKHKVNLLLGIKGFLYLGKLMSLNHRKTITYVIKKKYYSFLMKNEMQKFILRRYIKNLFIPTLFIKNKKKNKTTFLKDNVKNYKTFLNSSIIDNNSNFFSFSSILSDFFTINSRRFFINKLDYKNPERTTPSFFIKKIKFKPGYMNFWREARNVFKQILNLNFKYQSKLTKYLSKFNKILKFKLYLNIEMSIINILLRSKFFFDWATSDLFLSQGFIYVNGFLCFNKNFQLYSGDVIQMITNFKYYIFYKWLIHWFNKKKTKLRLRTRKKLTISYSDEDKIRTKKYPKWILLNRNTVGDSAKFLEIDFLTLSIYIIYEPLHWQDINPYSTNWTRFGVINMYNWKYIT